MIIAAETEDEDLIKTVEERLSQLERGVLPDTDCEVIDTSLQRTKEELIDEIRCNRTSIDSCKQGQSEIKNDIIKGNEEIGIKLDTLIAKVEQLENNNCRKRREQSVPATTTVKILVRGSESEQNICSQIVEAFRCRETSQLSVAVEEVRTQFQSKDWTVIDAKVGCIELYIQCSSVVSLLTLLRDYVNGNLDTYLEPLEKAARMLDGCADLKFETVFHEETVYNILSSLDFRQFEMKSNDVYEENPDHGQTNSTNTADVAFLEVINVEGSELDNLKVASDGGNDLPEENSNSKTRLILLGLNFGNDSDKVESNIPDTNGQRDSLELMECRSEHLPTSTKSDSGSQTAKLTRLKSNDESRYRVKTLVETSSLDLKEHEEARHMDRPADFIKDDLDERTFSKISSVTSPLETCVSDDKQSVHIHTTSTLNNTTISEEKNSDEPVTSALTGKLVDMECEEVRNTVVVGTSLGIQRASRLYQRFQDMNCLQGYNKNTIYEESNNAFNNKDRDESCQEKDCLAQADINSKEANDKETMYEATSTVINIEETKESSRNRDNFTNEDESFQASDQETTCNATSTVVNNMVTEESCRCKDSLMDTHVNWRPRYDPEELIKETSIASNNLELDESVGSSGISSRFGQSKNLLETKSSLDLKEHEEATHMKIPTSKDLFNDAGSVGIKGPKLVVALDVGNTYSGYSWNMRSDFFNDRDALYVKLDKTTPCILLEYVNEEPNRNESERNKPKPKQPDYSTIAKDYKVDSFGQKAERIYKNMTKDHPPPSKEIHGKFYFFKDFKRFFYGEKFNDKIEIEDILSQPLPLVVVMSKFIEALKDDFVNNPLIKRYDVSEEMIHWIVMVPSIWSPQAQKLMRVAAEMAGIRHEKLRVEKEPEAEVVYCKSKEERASLANLGLCGQTFMVADLEGQHDKKRVHDVPEREQIEKTKAASDDNKGEDYDLLQRNCEHFAFFCVQPRSYFKTKRRGLFPNKNKRTQINLPISLTEKYKNKPDNNLMSVIILSKHYDQIKFTRHNKLTFSVRHFRSLFKSLVENITILDQVINLDVATDSQWLQCAVRANLPHNKVVFLQEALTSVLKGMLTYTHLPRHIPNRVLKFTYGIRTNLQFREGIDPEGLRMQSDRGDTCKQRFTKHVERGQSIHFGEPQTEIAYNPLNKSQTRMCLHIYASALENPQYTDDNCTFVGKLIVDLLNHGDLNRSVKVSLTFSDNEINVTARDKKTGKKSALAFDFLG